MRPDFVRICTGPPLPRADRCRLRLASEPQLVFSFGLTLTTSPFWPVILTVARGSGRRGLRC